MPEDHRWKHTFERRSGGQGWGGAGLLFETRDTNECPPGRVGGLDYQPDYHHAHKETTIMEIWYVFYLIRGISCLYKSRLLVL